MASNQLIRGDVWDANLDPTQGHEQRGRRPVLVVSVDQFNQGPSGLVIVVLMTSKARSVRSHVAVKAGAGGLTQDSYAMCEAIRSISVERLTRRRGTVPGDTMAKVADRLKLLMDL
jgi:mRNA interferase MazF